MNTMNGKIQDWNLIETATITSTSIPWDYKGPWYKYFPNASNGKFGFGKRPRRERDICSIARFYTDSGWLALRWHTFA